MCNYCINVCYIYHFSFTYLFIYSKYTEPLPFNPLNKLVKVFCKEKSTISMLLHKTNKLYKTNYKLFIKLILITEVTINPFLFLKKEKKTDNKEEWNNHII